MSQFLRELGAQIVRVKNLSHLQSMIQSKQETMIDLAGLILGEDEEAWQWLNTVRLSHLFREVKILALKPFWFPKDDGRTIFLPDETITLPIHREQFYQCILGDKSQGSAKESMRKLGRPNSVNLQRTTGTPGKSSAKNHEGPSVLVVEDNPVNQKVAAGMLGKLGCQVIVVESGKKALQILQETDVDCILMDWELPEMDGLTTTRIIRQLEHAGRLVYKNTYWYRQHASASPPISHIPIVGMTAHVFPEHGQQCVMSGMDEWLCKPVHLHDLEKVLQRWIGFMPVGFGSFTVMTEDGPGSNPETVTFARSDKSGLKCSERQPDLDVYNLSAALQAMEGDEALLYSLFKIFNETSPCVIQDMKKSIQLKDRQEFQRQAHQIKGALRALHAGRQALLAERLETSASFWSFSSLCSKLTELENEIEELVCLFQRLASFREDRMDPSSSETACTERKS
jgi:CheY-like chemotaxis protein/HPt (histidine-containing phosphotransfer) domain-containing protein